MEMSNGKIMQCKQRFLWPKGKHCCCSRLVFLPLQTHSFHMYGGTHNGGLYFTVKKKDFFKEMQFKFAVMKKIL